MAEYKVSSSEMMVIFHGRQINANAHDRYNSIQDRRNATQDDIEKRILKYCIVPKTKKEIAAYLGYADEQGFSKRHLKPLLESKMLVMTVPNKPNSKNQKYITVKKS